MKLKVFKSEFLSEENSKILQKVIEEIQYKECKTLCDDTNCMKDLGLDSLDIIEFIMALEEEFNILLPDWLLPKDMRTITVGSIAKMIHLQNNGA